MDITKTELAAAITDSSVQSVVSGLTLPSGMEVAEFLAKILEGAYKATISKNSGLQPGNANYIASYPQPSMAVSISTSTGETSLRAAYAVVITAPISLDEAAAVNQ